MKPKCYLSFLLLINLVGLRNSHLLVADRTMSRMLEFTSIKPYCLISKDRDYIQNTILNSEQRRVKVISDEEIDKLEEICKKKQVKSSHQGGFIYPGTKWCGPGSIAANYSDLGNHKREDMCCREHDHCPNYLAKGECKLGICNMSPYTRSHCDCDATFRRCLQNVNSETANTIGAIFFNVIQVICFKQRNPCSDLQSSESTGMTNSIENEPRTDRNCTYKFTIAERYVPSEVIYHYRTKGEVLEAYVNKLFKRFKFL